MRAARYHGPLDLRIETIEEPDPRDGEVKVRVLYNGLCGTDVHEYFAGPSSSRAEPHPLTGVANPVVLGHEFSGEVVALGAGVGGVRVGDLVAIEPLLRCDACGHCATGAYNLCQSLGGIGFNWPWGGLGQFACVPRRNAHVVPEGCDPRHAALVEPLAVGHHAVALSGAREGGSAVVFGGGPIGLTVVLALHARGIRPVVSEPSSTRREVLSRLDLAEVIDPAEIDVQGAVMDATGGMGADVAFDAAGVEASFVGALQSSRRDGTTVVVAKHSVPTSLTPRLLYGTERRVVASLAYRNDFPAVVEAVAAGRYPLDWFSTIPFGDGIVADGLQALQQQRAMKILVDVGASAG